MVSAKSELKEFGSIDGWLLFLIITLVIISPIYNIYFLILKIESLSFVDIFDTLVSVSIFILAGIFLWMKKPYAVQFAKVFFITTLATHIVALFIMPEELNLVHYFLYYIIWIPYLYFSKRVKQVYGGLKEKSDGIQIWPILAIIYSIIAPILGAVLAIVSLNKIFNNRKLKGVVISIAALVMSVVVFFILMFYGALQVADLDYAPIEIESSCSSYCENILGATHYKLEYNTGSSEYACYCTDGSSNILANKKYPHELS